MIRTILTAVIILLLPLTSAAKISHRGEGCWRTIPKKHRALTRALLSGEKKDDVIRVNFHGHFKGLVILAEFPDKTLVPVCFRAPDHMIQVDSSKADVHLFFFI